MHIYAQKGLKMTTFVMSAFYATFLGVCMLRKKIANTGPFLKMKINEREKSKVF